MNSKELWKPVPGYESFYLASSLGRIKAVGGRVLKPGKCKNGYNTVCLYKNGVGRTKRAHRVIYETFFGGIPEEHDVHHKNGIKTDNRTENLVAVPRGRHRAEHNKGALSPRARRVSAIREGKTVFIAQTIAEAEKTTGIKYQNISACCRGLQKTAGGYAWEYCKE